MPTPREELIEYLDTHCIDSYGELQTCQVADFILEDRKRICAPLVKIMNENLNSGSNEGINYRSMVNRFRTASSIALKLAGLNKD